MIDTRFTTIAATQHGVAGRRQVLDAGVTDKGIAGMLARGEIDRLHAGVYGLRGAPHTFEWRITAYILAAGGRAFASHRAAAHLHGLRLDPRMEITVLHSRRPRLERGKTYRARRLPADHVCRVRGIPVTTLARTLLDLAGIIPDGVARLLDDVLGQKRITPDEIRAVLAGAPRAKGRAVLEKLLRARPDGSARSESPLEDELQALLVEERIDGWKPQHWLVVGGERYRVDIVFADAKLAIEIQSFRHHSSRSDWARDQRKTTGLVAAGWRVLPVTLEDMREGRERWMKLLREAIGALSAK